MFNHSRTCRRLVSMLLACGIATSATQVCAVDATSLPEFKNDPVFKTYLYGVGQGWLWANARLDTKRQPLLFCVPPSLKLEYENYLSLLEGKISNART